MHNAALRADYHHAESLMSEGLDANRRTGRTASPLVVAIVSGSAEMVKLLDRGADRFYRFSKATQPLRLPGRTMLQTISAILYSRCFPSNSRMVKIARSMNHRENTMHESHDFLLFIGARAGCANQLSPKLEDKTALIPQQILNGLLGMRDTDSFWKPDPGRYH